MTVLDRPRPVHVPRRVRRRLDKLLLGCGVAYGVVYVVANDVIAASRYHGYNRLDQAVSELSGTAAPTRTFLVAMLPAFTVLVVGFGVGVWRAAQGRRALRTVGALLVALGLTGVAWLPFPMTSREDLAAGANSSGDLGHLVLSGITVTGILALFAFGSRAFGKRWRVYSITSAAITVVSFALMSVPAAKVQDGDPTPWMGLYERIGMGTWMAWMAALAVTLLRERTRPAGDPTALRP